MMLHVVNSTNIQTIEVNFLERGHTQMEADSMHSAIEGSKKSKSKLFSMNDWGKVILKARRKDKNERLHPYQHHALEYHNIYDFKELGLIRNKNVDVQGEKVNWMKVKALRFSKYPTSIIFYKNDPAATEWKQRYSWNTQCQKN